MTSHLPAATKNGGNLAVVHRRKIAAAAEGFTDEVEYSDLLNPGGWTTAVHGIGGVTIGKVTLDAETEEITTSVPALGDKRFARLKVVAP